MNAATLLFTLLPGLLKAAEEIVKSISDDGKIDADEAHEIARVALINEGIPETAAIWIAQGLVELLVSLGVWDDKTKRIHLHAHKYRWLSRLNQVHNLAPPEK